MWLGKGPTVVIIRVFRADQAVPRVTDVFVIFFDLIKDRTSWWGKVAPSSGLEWWYGIGPERNGVDRSEIRMFPDLIKSIARGGVENLHVMVGCEQTLLRKDQMDSQRYVGLDPWP